MSTSATARVIGPTRRAPRVPEAWLRATLAGVEAALIGWLLVVVPTVAAYVATAAAPVLGEASWVDAAVVGTGIWLLGHGATVVMVGSGVVSLAPLGLSLVSVGLIYGAARRARLRSHATAAFTLGGYLVCVLGISAIVPGPAGRVGIAATAVVMAAVALQLALWRSRALPPSWWVRLRSRLPDLVASGVRAGIGAVVALLIVATVLTVTALVQGVVTVLELHEALEVGRLGTVALVLGQLAYLPTAIVWVLAWLVGPGFAVGAGTVFSPTEVVAGPLPAVPMLGALPAPGSPDLGWWILVGIAVGAGLGGWLHRQRFEAVWWRAALSGVVAAAVAAVVVALLTQAAAGSIGPGRMAVVGASPPAVAGAVAWQLALGAVVVLLAAHPQVHAGVAAGYRALRRQATGLRRGDASADEDDHDAERRVAPSAD
ncbi:DUF6350 family protein [Georgenia sp. MJ173]|uniref:cell division protein PerM n=1 Tax=Georgenia sunbinii TaxID=3117728 RepID=UPI002F261EAA